MKKALEYFLNDLKAKRKELLQHHKNHVLIL